MATQTYTRRDFVDSSIIVWNALVNGDDGQPGPFIGSGDRTVQVTGTFGTGGTLVIEGSLDGVNWSTIRDWQSTALSFTAAAVRSVLEVTPFIRPRVTGGDGTTALTVQMYVRRENGA